VDAATAAQKGQIKSTYANLGLTGSTMEAQAVGAVDRNAAAENFSIADKLLTSGLTAQGQSANIYSSLLQNQMQQDEQFQKALTLFASGLAGGGRGGVS
jgi:hypothetical protein